MLSNHPSPRVSTEIQHFAPYIQSPTENPSITGSHSWPSALPEHKVVGAGTGYQWLSRQISNLFVPKYSQEQWEKFFEGHFQSPVFNPSEESRIDVVELRNHIENVYLPDFEKRVKRNQHVYVSFDKAPECRADRDGLSPRLDVTGYGRPMHVSLVLVRRTLRKLHDALLETAGEEKIMHIVFKRKPAEEEESAPNAGGSAQGFFFLAFRDVAAAMPQFGTTNPDASEPGVRNIPGLAVIADFSGLKIESREDLMHLHSMLLRTTIADLRLDLSLMRAPPVRQTAWTELTKTLKASANLFHLTLDLSEQEEETSLDAAKMLKDVLVDKDCVLKSLTFNGGDWSEEAKGKLLEGVKEQLERAPEELAYAEEELESVRVQFETKKEPFERAKPPYERARQELDDARKQLEDVTRQSPNASARASAEGRVRRAMGQLAMESAAEPYTLTRDEYARAAETLERATKRFERAKQRSEEGPTTITINGQKLELPAE